MESHPKSAFIHMQSPLQALLCPFVLLPYLLLPAVYYGQLTVAFLPAYQEDLRAGSLAIGTYHEKTPKPFHDSKTCPICQAASCFQSYGFFSVLQIPECASSVRLSVCINSTFSITSCAFLVLGPRAPPDSL